MIDPVKKTPETILLEKALSGFYLKDSKVYVLNALDGGDYFSTGFRAGPQVFGGIVLPLPLLQVITIVLAGGVFAWYAKKKHDEALLTDEMHLTLLALAGAKDQLEKDERAKFDAIMAKVQKDDALIARSESLQAFLDLPDNKSKIMEILHSSVLEKPGAERRTKPSRVSFSDEIEVRFIGEPSKARHYWDNIFTATYIYAAAHWVFWMIWELGYYIEDENYSKNPWKAPGVLEAQYAMILQFLLPAVVALGVVFYNEWHRANEIEKNEQVAWADKQQKVRAYYYTKTSQNIIPCTSLSPITEKNTVRLAMATTFLDTFLILNLFAWPLTGFLEQILSNGDTDNPALIEDIKIPVIFISTILISILQTYLKKKDMHDECPQSGATAKSYSPTQTMGTFYQKNKWMAAYFIFGNALGSSGILLTRTLLDGGIVGHAAHKSGWVSSSNSIDHISIALPIAAVMTLLTITLHLYKNYYMDERNKGLQREIDTRNMNKFKGK